MDASHVLVGGLTAICIVLLLWVEIRSRRNRAAQLEEQSVSLAPPEAQLPPKKRWRRRG